MAVLEVRIKYETFVSRILYLLIVALSPLWALLPLALWFCHLLHVYTAYDYFDSGAFPLFVVGISLLFYLREHQLVVSQQGICLPTSMFSAIGRRNYPWYKLKAIYVLGSSDTMDFRNYQIRLEFQPARRITISLKYFSPNELEQTLLALETFGGAANGQESLLSLKKMLQKELKSNGQKSFTNLWDDELRYRYAATTFIPLAPGTELQEGRVRVLRQLGFGGLSAIYLVQRNKMELAILKESVLPADVDDELRRKAEEQFQREAMILAKLDHPHISKVLDYFVERGHYLLLDYVTGHDLRQLVQEGGCLSEEQVREYAREIANILEYLHGREPAIIHRDLTPENMILDENGNITVIDFGAANEFLHTATGTLVGKHCYMAPEQLRGKANKQSDLYSLGCCLYFLLTGKDPVPLSASRPSQQRSDISDELDQLICDLTQTSLDARINSAAALKERLEDLHLGQGTVVCSKTLMME